MFLEGYIVHSFVLHSGTKDTHHLSEFAYCVPCIGRALVRLTIVNTGLLPPVPEGFIACNLYLLLAFVHLVQSSPYQPIHFGELNK